MSWQQVTCLTTSADADGLSLLLETVGALSITYQDAEDKPIFEPQPNETPLWDTVSVTALYEATHDLTALSGLIKEAFPQTENIVIDTLEDQQWERAWMDDFHPMQFGERLWIYPTHYNNKDTNGEQAQNKQLTENNNNIYILLDPGLAFGTGTHPTTALCLQWLDQHPPKDLQLMDYGCGSGVLAMAAIKLGAKHVIATDIDEQALLATQENCKTNTIANNSIDTCFPEQLTQYHHQTIDCLLANILSAPLCELASTFATFLKPQGAIVLSGILKEQQQDIIDAYMPFFDHIQYDHLDGWLRITGIRKRNLPTHHSLP